MCWSNDNNSKWTRNKMKLDRCVIMNIAGPAHKLLTVSILHGSQHWQICFTPAVWSLSTLLLRLRTVKKVAHCAYSTQEVRDSGVCASCMVSDVNGSQELECAFFSLLLASWRWELKTYIFTPLDQFKITHFETGWNYYSTCTDSLFYCALIHEVSGWWNGTQFHDNTPPHRISNI